MDISQRSIKRIVNEFIKKIHPDNFYGFPSIQKINSNTTALLNDLIQSQNDPSAHNETYKNISFYLWTDRQNCKFELKRYKLITANPLQSQLAFKSLLRLCGSGSKEDDVSPTLQIKINHQQENTFSCLLKNQICLQKEAIDDVEKLAIASEFITNRSHIRLSTKQCEKQVLSILKEIYTSIPSLNQLRFNPPLILIGPEFTENRIIRVDQDQAKTKAHPRFIIILIPQFKASDLIEKLETIKESQGWSLQNQ